MKKNIINIDYSSDEFQLAINNKEVLEIIKNEIDAFNIENDTNIELLEICSYGSSSSWPNINILANVEEFKKMTLLDEEDYLDFAGS